MEIKSNILKNKIIFYFILIFSFQVAASPIELVKLNEKNQLSEFESKNSLSKTNFDFSKIVDGSNKILSLVDLATTANKEIYSLADVNNITLGPGEYIRIQGPDKRKLLFNGSIIIKFQSFPDLENFAIQHGIEFKTSLSDINMAVFKINNVLDSELTIDNLKEDANIIAIQLDTKDPSIRPN